MLTITIDSAIQNSSAAERTLETRLFLACNAFATKKQDKGHDKSVLMFEFILEILYLSLMKSYKDIYFDTLVKTVTDFLVGCEQGENSTH